MCTSSYIKSILVSVFCRHACASIGGHRFVLIAWFVEVRFFLLYLYILFSRPTIFRSKLIACTISYVPFFFILFVFILFLATVAQHTNYDFLWKNKNWIKWFKKKMGAAIKKNIFVEGQTSKVYVAHGENPKWIIFLIVEKFVFILYVLMRFIWYSVWTRAHFRAITF